MSLLDQLGGLLQQYAAGQQTAGTEVDQHFDQVAQAVPSSDLAEGVAEALRSNQTPPFAQLAGQLFAGGNGEQQANMLNTLLASLGPGALGGALGGLLGGGSSLTPQQAASVSPEDVQALAEKAEQQDPSIIDRLSGIYAEHPTLIKTLGAVARGIAMRKIGERHTS